MTKPAYYGSAQELYDVHEGDLWRIGPHTLICADTIDLFESNQLQNLIPPCDILHTDPPWTPAIYNSFYKWRGSIPPRSFDTFVDLLIQAIHYLCPKGLMIVESGHNLMPVLKSKLFHSGAHLLRSQLCTYTPKRTLYYHWIGTFGSAALPDNLYASGTHDNASNISITAHTVLPGSTFVDPLCGRMTFLEPAIRYGATVYGCELIPRKFAEGLRALSKFGKPECITRL